MGLKISNKFNFLNLIIPIVFIVSLLYVSSTLSDGFLAHKYPGVFFYARDAAYSSQLGIDILLQNDFSRPNFVSGGVVSYYYRPPLFGVSLAMLSDLTGIHPYDVGSTFILLIHILMMLTIYLILKKYSTTLANFSLPLMLLFIKNPFSMAITTGRWPSTLNLFYLVLVVAVYIFFKSKPFLLGSLLGFSFMSHTRETMYFIIVIIPLFLAFELLNKKLKLKTILNLFYSSVVAGILFLGYLPYVFYLAFLRPEVGGGRIVNKIDVTRFDYVSFADFSWIKYLLFAGIIIGALYVYKKKFVKPYLFALGYLIITSGWFALFRKAVSQDRFFYPIFFSIFFAFTLYFIYELLSTSLRSKRILEISLFAIMLALIFFTFPFEKYVRAPYIDSYTSKGYDWIRENTPKDAVFVDLYGDAMDSDAKHWPSQRQFYMAKKDEFFNAIKSGMMNFTYNPHGNEPYTLRNGLFDFKIINPNEKYSPFTLCEFDYVYIQTYSKIPAAAIYSQMILYDLINKRGMTVAYKDELVTILKNDYKTKDCIKAYPITENEYYKTYQKQSK